MSGGLDSGLTLARSSADTALRTDELVYKLSGVERNYSRGERLVRAVRGIDLEIAVGEMVALEGPSGSGKSTLLQLLGCLEVPSAGRISFLGRELAKMSERELTRIRSADIGFVFQQFNLVPTLSSAENVAIAMPGRLGHGERLARANALLQRVGLGHRLAHLPSRLSGGEQQRVAVARALANSPRVLIADEPTGNLDSETAAEVISLIAEVRDDSEVTVILATHDEEIARRAGRRVRLRDGKIRDQLVRAPSS
ncbi:MAG: ABC transporter ATP-binding protein [Acidimicrobiales bacterium]